MRNSRGADKSFQSERMSYTADSEINVSLEDPRAKTVGSQEGKLGQTCMAQGSRSNQLFDLLIGKVQLPSAACQFTEHLNGLVWSKRSACAHTQTWGVQVCPVHNGDWQISSTRVQSGTVTALARIWIYKVGRKKEYHSSKIHLQSRILLHVLPRVYGLLQEPLADEFSRPQAGI